jgi:hypothetical protein
MKRVKIDRSLPLDSTFERERNWRGGPQGHPEPCVASVEECRPADQVYASRHGHQPDGIALGEPLRTGR